MLQLDHAKITWIYYALIVFGVLGVAATSNQSSAKIIHAASYNAWIIKI